MFDNAGGKLRSILKVIVIIWMVVVAICGLGLAISGIGRYGSGSAALSGLLLAIVGPFLIWLFSLYLMAVLEAIEDIHYIREVVQNGAIGSNNASVRREPQNWACPSCGYTNTPDSLFCVRCGTKNK